MKRRNFISSTVSIAASLPALNAFGNNIIPTHDTVINSEETVDVINQGISVFKEGMPVPFQWFTDDRLSFEMDEQGVTRAIYLNPLTRSGNPLIFKRRLFDGFRLYIEQDHLTYSPQLKNYSFLPFGFTADWIFKDIVIKYSCYAAEESIVFNITLPDNAPSDISCKLEFYDSFQLTPCDPDDFLSSSMGATRIWKKWNFDNDNNILCGGFTETPNEVFNVLNQSETNKWQSFLDICITADAELIHIVREQNIKRILRSKNPLQPGKSISYIISFIPEEDPIAKTKIKLAKSQNTIKEQINHYKEISQKHPVLISPHPALNNFIALAPIFHEVLKVKGFPGATRSSNVFYWVWGWDGMTSNNSLAYWGDSNYIKQMLGCYMETADPVNGIVHAFRYDMSIGSCSYTPSQGIYISMLYLYYCMTHDLDEVKKRYDFSKKIFDRILALEVSNTGFCKGYSLYPDFPKFMKETGKDISLFNNSLFYSAARSFECLAILMDDIPSRDKARAVFTRFEKNFLPRFFNSEKKFFVSSVDSETLEQRDSYNLSSVKWDVGYYADLVETVSSKTIQFIEKNLISNVGLREIPVWDESFDGDGNQLHCWFTANSQYFIRTCSETNRADLLAKFQSWIEYWIGQLTIPEGINFYAENTKPERERWNSLSGDLVMFGIKEWYLSVIHGIVGVDTGPGGITFYPYDGEEMKLEGLHYMGRQFDIEMRGSGKYISEIDVDGFKYRGTNILPFDSFKNTINKRIRIIVQRSTQKQTAIFIKSGYGIELHDFSFQNKIIKTRVGGLGTCYLKLHADTEPKISVNGKKGNIFYHPDLQLAIVKFVFDKNEPKDITIRL
jgi:hypothetical protein